MKRFSVSACRDRAEGNLVAGSFPRHDELSMNDTSRSVPPRVLARPISLPNRERDESVVFSRASGYGKIMGADLPFGKILRNRTQPFPFLRFFQCTKCVASRISFISHVYLITGDKLTHETTKLRIARKRSSGLRGYLELGRCLPPASSGSVGRLSRNL